MIAAFIERYNEEWLIERLGYRTPGAGPGRGVEGRGVRIRLSHPRTEGRSVFRSAFDEGGAIWVFPETGHMRIPDERPRNRVRYRAADSSVRAAAGRQDPRAAMASWRFGDSPLE